MPSSPLLVLCSMLAVNGCLVVGTVLSKLGIVQSYTSRKIVHISLGVCQMMLWGLYPDEPTARIWGNACTLFYAAVFLVFGLGLVPGRLNDFLVATVCRNGDCREMLYGPLNYCVTMSLFGLVFWRNYPSAIAGAAVMLTGDGMAEVIGKFIGKTRVKNPWGREKTVEGAVAVLVFGALGAMALNWAVVGDVHVGLALGCGLVGSLAEFFSPPNYDNVFIPLSGLLVGVAAF